MLSHLIFSEHKPKQCESGTEDLRLFFQHYIMKISNIQ